MILPSKHIPTKQTLLGVGAVLLQNMSEPRTVSALWEIVRGNAVVGTFDRYVLAMDLLHVLGVVQIHSDGLLTRE
jgi:hypothetical protein